MNGSEIVDAPISKAIVSAGNFAYLKIPTADLRSFFDSTFPSFAKNSIADCSTGYLHRFHAGHDILLDVPKTVLDRGFKEGTKHLGHILLTDFPTKAGIPIPGFSESGLGHWLTNVAGIPKPYLCLNVMDAAVGLFACSEGTLDILNVCAKNVRMSPQVFVDTFVEGGLEVAAGGGLKNPLLIAAGVENIAAGIYSTCYTITHPLWYVGFWDVAGCSLTGGMASFLISRFVLKKTNEECCRNVITSCAISALYSITPGFGIAGMTAMLASCYGKFLAEKENDRKKALFKITKENYFQFIKDMAEYCPELWNWIREFERKIEIELPEYSVKLPEYAIELPG